MALRFAQMAFGIFALNDPKGQSLMILAGMLIYSDLWQS